MACNQISGITYTCLTSAGGIKKMYITNFSNITGTTANGIGTITDIEMVDGTKFQEFQFQRDTSSYEEDTMINIQNGTTFYNQTVHLVIPRRDAAKNAAISVLANGQPLLALIVEDYNGLYWYIGLATGAYLTQGKSGSGVKRTDANDYKLTFIAEEVAPAPEVDAEIIASII